VSLKHAGFSTIDGADLSQKILDIARDTGVYRNLALVEPDSPPAAQIADYRAITATGVISRGAAPPSLYGDMLDVMQPGAVLAFSINDLSLEDPDYAGLVPASVKDGAVDLLFEQHGVHLAKYGKNSGSTVYVVERLG
jgi:predicted TPR repeat methyltransferase